MSKNKHFFATSSLIIKSFLGQPIGIIISFLAPSTLTILLPFLAHGSMNMDINNPQIDMQRVLTLLIPGLVLVPAFMCGFIGVPITYGNMKETRMLKRLNVAGIKPSLFILSFFFVFFFIMIFACILQYFLALAIWQLDVPVPETGVFILPWLLIILVCIVAGVLISNIANSQALAFAMGVALFLPSLFLSGIMFIKLEGWVKEVSWFVPQTGLVNLFKLSWSENTFIFKPYNNIDLTWFDDTISSIFAFAYPIGLSIVQIGLTIKIFKYE